MLEQVNFFRGSPERLIAPLQMAILEKKRCSVFFCNAHMVTEMAANDQVRSAVVNADIVVADGAPVAALLRLGGVSEVQRLRGPDAFMALLKWAEQSGATIGLYGGAPPTLLRLQDEVRSRFPALKVAFAVSPPVGDAASLAAHYRAAGLPAADLVFVGLGCPKQELFISEAATAFRGPVLAVGAAFDFVAGTKPIAPSWMQEFGLEWIFRLCSEPKRLWRRYLVGNLLFIALSFGEAVRLRRAQT